jgi:hypothetical protein
MRHQTQHSLLVKLPPPILANINFMACKHGTSTGMPHYGRTEIPRVSNSFSSAKNRALGEANLLGEEGLSRVLQNPWHSGKGGTRGKSSSPSATLGGEGHSQKEICI